MNGCHALWCHAMRARFARKQYQEKTMNLQTVLDQLLQRLDNDDLAGTYVKRCWAPVPYFGDLSNARVASVGINPSNKEFENDSGNEIVGHKRRFHTLKSLGISCWSEADNCHTQQILESCTKYFESDRNPYDRWFKPLDKIVAGTGASFYCSDACHLDLVPYATTDKWSSPSLKKCQKSKQLSMNRDVIGQLLSVSPIEVLVLNGKTAVDGFQEAASIRLECERMDDWTLNWKNGPRFGFAYRGVVSCFPSIVMNRKLLVLGYNHNIPNTPGVSNVVDSIKEWIASNYSNWKR